MLNRAAAASLCVMVGLGWSKPGWIVKVSPSDEICTSAGHHRSGCSLLLTGYPCVSRPKAEMDFGAVALTRGCIANIFCMTTLPPLLQPEIEIFIRYSA